MKYSTLDSGIEFPMGRGRSARVVSPDVGAEQITLNLSIFEDGDEFPQHIHDVSEDCFIVLDGSVSLRQGESYTPLLAGQAVWVPVGEVHGTYNHSGTRAELISFQSPPDYALYRGDRDGAHGELPVYTGPSLSRVVTLGEEKLGSTNGTSVERGTIRSAVDPERSARHLVVEHITLEPGGRVEVQPDDNEHIVIMLAGYAEAQRPGVEQLQPRSILYGSPVDGVELVAGSHGALVLHSFAQAKDAGR